MGLKDSERDALIKEAWQAFSDREKRGPEGPELQAEMSRLGVPPRYGRDVKAEIDRRNEQTIRQWAVDLGYSFGRPRRASLVRSGGRGQSPAVSPHFLEVAEQFIESATLLLAQRAGPGGDPDHVAYARAHLFSPGAYPELEAARSAALSASAKLADLVGPANPLVQRGYPGGNAGAQLERESLVLLQRVFPGPPRYPIPGVGQPAEFVAPENLATHLWIEIGAAERGGHSAVPQIQSIPFDVGEIPARWKVTQAGVNVFAVVQSRQVRRERLLAAGIQKLLVSPELHELWKRVEQTQALAGNSREAFLQGTRDLGRRIQNGEPLRGTCRLGF